MTSSTILRCRSCRKLLPEDSSFCMYCGAAQVETQKQKQQKKTRRPSDSGTIRKLPGNRQHPYAAYLPNSMGRKYLGSFATAIEASNALLREIATRPSTSRADWTIADFYQTFCGSDAYKSLTKSAKQSHATAWKYFNQIESLKMRDVKKSHLQSVVDAATESGKSRAICEKIRNLSSILCQLAMSDDVMDKNYARLLDLPKAQTQSKNIFTNEEIKLLKSHDGDIEARLILILIFSGMRVGELLTLKNADINTEYWFAIGGEKTEAGRNRIIPFVKTIQPYVSALISDADSLVTMPDGRPMRREYFEKVIFKKYLIKIGILEEPAEGERWRLSPHSARHTYASLSRKAGIDKDILSRVIGHTDYDQVTDKHYVELDAQFLSAEIAKLENIM